MERHDLTSECLLQKDSDYRLLAYLLVHLVVDVRWGVAELGGFDGGLGIPVFCRGVVVIHSCRHHSRHDNMYNMEL